jgi:tRNA G18 (ribose-2'-O)-methylase SpoU
MSSKNESMTKRKFLKFPLVQQHKECASLLRNCYENSQPLALYQTLSSWMSLSSFDSLDKKELAERYHWHLAQSGRSLKEHHLLPRLRTGTHEPKADYLPISIYLDRLRSVYNVGSILRTCEALRIGSVYFSSRTPFIDNEKVERTAMGAAPLVPCYRDQLLADLPRPIFVLDTSDDAIPLAEFLFPPAFTLVLGNEECGVSENSLALADALIEIPLLGGQNSLNVACAFAIAAAEIRRQHSQSSLKISH